MRKSAVLLLPLLLVLVLGASACGKSQGPGTSSSGSTVTMTTDNFASNSTSITIPAGGTVTYVDPATASVHLLCLGKNQACDGSIKGGPPEFSDPNNPDSFSPGDTKKITFPSKGDFPVTCTVHPNMNMVVHVQ